MCSRMSKLIALSALLALVCALAGSAMADSISQAEALATGTTGVTLDNASGGHPVVTAILSEPGTFGGKSYSSWSFFVKDSTGSADVYGTLSGLGYTPAVGDAVTVTGEWSPYHQLPELEYPTAISAVSSGNPVPNPVSATISQLNQTTLPANIAGYLATVSNVTIVGASGNFPSGNTSYTISDGTNSMTLYDWTTSYSCDGALIGTPIPTGPVNITGFMSVYPGTPGSPEFTPISITAVPEPATLVLLAAAGICGLALRCVRRHGR